MSLEIWDKMKRPPKEALKQIKAGRLQGMSDINPQWRYKVMTETFGPCGVGWAYDISRLWLEPAVDGQVMAFAEIKLMTWVKEADRWSYSVPGIGGSTFIAKEKSGLHASDECYKMAVTDALSVAMKALGVGADIYAGLWDGSKYKTEEKQQDKPPATDKQKISLDDWKKRFDTESEKTLAGIKLWRLKNGKEIVATISDDDKKNLKEFLDSEEKKRTPVTCPETGKVEDPATCEGKNCRNGCPEFNG